MKNLENLIEANVPIADYLKQDDLEMTFEEFIRICDEFNGQTEIETRNEKINLALKMANDFVKLNLFECPYDKIKAVEEKKVEKENYDIYTYLKTLKNINGLNEEEKYEFKIDNKKSIFAHVKVFEPFQENGLLSPKWHVFIALLAVRDIATKEEPFKSMTGKALKYKKLSFNEKIVLGLGNMKYLGIPERPRKDYTSKAMLEWICEAVDAYCNKKNE